MGLRSRNKEDKLLRIEQAGRELFAEHGFDNTTTRALARHAGIGTGTLFVYFPNKLDLLVHLFLKDIAAVIEEAMADVPDDADLVSTLLAIFGPLYGYYEKDERLTRAFMKEMPFLMVRPDELTPESMGRHGATLQALLMRLTRIVHRAKRRGEIPADVSELDATYHFFGAYYWSLMTRLAGVLSTRDQQLQQLEHGLRMLVAGMQRPPGASAPEPQR